MPLEAQTGLPAGTRRQGPEIGGALAIGSRARTDDVWDEIDADQVAAGSAGLNQVLSNFSFTAETFSKLILSYNERRTYLLVQNNGASEVRLAFGKEADLMGGIVLSASGGFYEPILGTVNSVHGIAAAGTSQVTVVEGFRV